MGLNLCGQLVHELGKKIISGEIATDSCIPSEEELRSKYDVSRTVTREAIRALIAKGLVESKPKKGTSVCPTEKWNFLDIDVLNWSVVTDQSGGFFQHLHQLRSAIEPEAASIVAKNGPQELLDFVVEQANKMESLADSPEEYSKADLDFHKAILMGAKNPLFNPIINVIHFAQSYTLKMTNNKQEDNLESIPIHKAIANSIAARQVDLSKASMIAHFDHLATRLDKYGVLN
jgi:DNA-binding FadR family transcriptional regulator